MSILPAAGQTLAQTTERAKEYARSSRADATWKAYASDWAVFVGFCQSVGEPSLPASPQTVAAFLAEQAEKFKPSTIERRLAAISVRHKAEGFPTPCSDEAVLSVKTGIKREKGTRPEKKQPVRVQHVRAMVAGLGNSPLEKRDRLIILLGYAGGFRRSELVALDWEDVEFVEQGAKVLVRKSKSDQEGKGQLKFIPYGSHKETCPVTALKDWLEVLEVAEGPVFRPLSRWGEIGSGRFTSKGVARVVKRLAERAGLDPDKVGGHSLRSGLVTDGYASGVAESDIAAMTGHKSRAVLEGYRQEADGFKRNVAGAVGL